MQYRVSGFLNHPEASLFLRRFFEKSLVKANPQILILTEARRAEWDFNDLTGALALQPKGPPMWGFKPANPRPNKAPTFERSAVITPDGDSEEDFKYFTHELAHTWFADFILRNFDRICARFPSSFAKWENGQCQLHVDLISLLHEKYAYEMEHRLPMEVERTHGRRRDRRYFDLMPKERALALGPDATDWSGVEYWPVVQLRDLSVSEILLAGSKVKAIDAAFKAMPQN